MKKILFYAHLSMALLYSQQYYGAMKDIGKISEAGADIIFYFNNDTVRAQLRNHTNMYGNRYIHLFGRGTINDKSLEMESIIWEEENYYDGGVFKLNFKNDKLIIDRLPDFILLKEHKFCQDYMGNPIKLKDIKFDESYFKVNTGRKIRLTKYDKNNIQENLNKLNHYIETKEFSADKINKYINDPVAVIVFIFDEILPKNLIEKKYNKEILKNGKYIIDMDYNGYTYKTCDDNYNIEEDYEGKCKTVNFYHNTKQTGDVILVEVEIHSTCLDDSCSHEYHQIRLLKNANSGWVLLSHKNGLRCDESRGGGSPPCL